MVCHPSNYSLVDYVCMREIPGDAWIALTSQVWAHMVWLSLDQLQRKSTLMVFFAERWTNIISNQISTLNLEYGQ